MKKVELLSPAGNKEMLKSAIHNGADAVYLSGIKFGARKFADNFTNEELVNAIKYAHLYGVKVYVTINTLIKDNEVKEFIEYVEFLHKNNVDAVLMQDIGMIYLVRKTFPNLEIHASTQFHNHNIEDLKFLKSIGIKRAVLARELSINDIKNLDVDIEKEVFVHGALCICYSGECLMSSIIMNRSGNRGCCAGMCRLPYRLYENEKRLMTEGDYLLSTKELCTLENLKDILDANIDSIKIEGRMKSPEYVGYVTKLYRKALNQYYENKQIKFTEEKINNLKVLYNREFTKGYILNDNENIINQISPNHKGIKIGKVIKITDKYIKIKLEKELNQEDAIRFNNSNLGMYANFIYDENKRLINKGKINQIILIDNKVDLKELDDVYKTIDIKLINEIKNYEEKKIPIEIEAIIKKDRSIEIKFKDENNIVETKGSKPEIALSNPITKEIVEEKLTKLGNSIYICKNFKINLDKNIFIPIKELNVIRRTLIEKLNNKRLENKTEFKKVDYNYKKSNITETKSISILIDTEQDYLDLNKFNANFYTENKVLYEKYKNNKNIYFRLKRVINNFEEYKNEKLLINDIGAINKYKDNNEINADIYSNVTNCYSAKFLSELGVKRIGVSPELSIEEANNLYETYIKVFNETPNLEIQIYGKIELMLLKHCVIKTNINKEHKCNMNCKKNNYYLEDRNNKKYKLITNNCYTKLLNYKAVNYLNKINNLKIKNYYISLIDITKKEREEIIKFLKENNNDKIYNS